MSTEHRTRRLLDHQLLDHFVQHAPIAIAVLEGSELRYAFVNPAYRSIMGAESEFIGRRYRDVFPDSAARGAESALKQVMETGRAWRVRDFETEIAGRSGLTWWNGECLPLPAADGSPGGVLVITWEVTERRRAEVALRHSDESLRLAAAAARFGTYDLDLATGENLWSREAKAIAGLPDDDAGLPIDAVMNLIHPQDRERVREKMQASFRPDGAGEFEDEHRLVRADGAVLWVFVKGRTTFSNTDGRRPVRAIGVILDITEAMQARQALRESERRLSTLVSNLPGMAYRRRNDRDGTMEFVSEGVNAITGFAPEVFVSGRVQWSQIQHPEDVQSSWQAVQEALRERRPFRFEYRLRHKDGSERWVLEQGQGVFDGGDEPRAIEGFVTDLTERRRSEQALRESEARKSAMLETALDAIISIDQHGRIVEFNPAAERIFGYPRDEVVGNELAPLIIPPAQRERHHRGMARYLATGEGRVLGRRVEMSAVRAAGEEFPVELAVTAIRTSGPALFTAYLRDITERKRSDEALRENEARFRTLADNMSQLAWMADEKGWIFWYNRRWHDYTGTTLEEMQGWGWKKVHHPEHVERVVARIQRSWDTGEIWEDTFPLRGKDGSYRWFLSRAEPIRNEHGAVVRWFGTNTDITEQREAEAALREASRAKDEFLATLSHELRNPLAPLRNSLELLRRSGELTAAAQPLQEIMERQVHHLVRLVDDLMEMARITRGTFELRREPLELQAVLRNGIETAKPLIDAAGHRLRVQLPEEPVRLDGDAVRLAQVFANLLNNASKYTPPGGEISVAASCEGDAAVVSISDNGEGIDPAELPRLFEMFSRGSSTSRSQGGLGIGLALVRRLVEMHRGSVHAWSAGAGKGSRFTVKLPVGAPTRAAASAPPEADRRLVRQQVLVVDDNRDAATSLGMLLNMLGAEVCVVHDGPAALEAFDRQRPQAVVLDIGMPGMNGYEVARAIRLHAHGARVPLIALTGWSQDEDRRRAKAAGFDHHLVKPADIEALRTLLGSLAK